MQPKKKSKKQEKISSYLTNFNDSKNNSSSQLPKNMTKSDLLSYLKGELLKIEGQIKELNLKKTKILDLISECEQSMFLQEKNSVNKQEISFSKIDEFLNQSLDNDLEKGWLKNSVVDLARNIFDKVDFGLFEMNYSQPLKIGESNSQPIILEEDSKGVSDNQESQFFIHSLNSNINNIDKEKKKNYEILKYTKPILKKLEAIEEMDKEQLSDLAVIFGLKGKNNEKNLKKHLITIREYLVENKLPADYLKGYESNINNILDLNNE